MRRTLPHVIALLLGAGAALLVACGGGGTKGGIPAASAGELKDQLASVRRAVADKRCDDVTSQLTQVDEDIGSLPGTVDKRLRKSLGDAADLLRQTAKGECKTETTQTQTQTAPAQTQTQTTQTRTLPPQTQTTPPATTTTPPVTQPPATTIPPVTPPSPPASPPPPVPVTPPPTGSGGSGGGATPDIP